MEFNWDGAFRILSIGLIFCAVAVAFYAPTAPHAATHQDTAPASAHAGAGAPAALPAAHMAEAAPAEHPAHPAAPAPEAEALRPGLVGLVGDPLNRHLRASSRGACAAG